MKNILFVFLLFFSNIAISYSYDVYGTDEYGQPVTGVVDAYGEKEVTGTIYDENGVAHEFEGQWDGYGQITGETDTGVTINLETE